MERSLPLSRYLPEVEEALRFFPRGRYVTVEDGEWLNDRQRRGVSALFFYGGYHLESLDDLIRRAADEPHASAENWVAHRALFSPLRLTEEKVAEVEGNFFLRGDSWAEKNLCLLAAFLRSRGELSRDFPEREEIDYCGEAAIDWLDDGNFARQGGEGVYTASEQEPALFRVEEDKIPLSPGLLISFRPLGRFLPLPNSRYLVVQLQEGGRVAGLSTRVGRTKIVLEDIYGPTTVYREEIVWAAPLDPGQPLSKESFDSAAALVSRPEGPLLLTLSPFFLSEQKVVPYSRGTIKELLEKGLLFPFPRRLPLPLPLSREEFRKELERAAKETGIPGEREELSRPGTCPVGEKVEAGL